MESYTCSDFPVYHTAFDSYEWLTKHADPLFHRHVAGQCLFSVKMYAYCQINYKATHNSFQLKMGFLFFIVSVAGIWGLLALHLADESILPFDYLTYVEQLQVRI